MSGESVSPSNIRLSAKPGESAHQDFIVHPMHRGTIIASIEGDDRFIKLREIVACDRVRKRVPDDEFALLPPSLQDEAHRWYIEFIETGRAGPNAPLPVRPGQHVSGLVECEAPLSSPFSYFNAGLIIDGLGTERREVPIVFVIGEMLIEFLDRPVVARQYQWTEASVRVSLPGAPTTNVTFSAPTGYVEIPRTTVEVPEGLGATVTLSLRAAPNAPLGPISVSLNVNRGSDWTDFVDIEVTVELPQHPPELNGAQAIKLIHEHYMRTGGREGVLGYPVSDVELLSRTTAVREYRSGRIEASLFARSPVGVITQALKTREARVTFLGFKCVKEAAHDGLSDTDEPYFIIAVDTGNGVPRTQKFGPFSNIETNSEVGVGAFLVDGIAPNPLSIRVAAYEHDHGDPDETARAIQAKLVELAQAAQAAAAGSGADAASGPGIGPASTAGAVGLIAGPLGALAAIGIVSLLGLGDDWIGQGVSLAFNRPEKAITPTEMGQFQGIPYNVKVGINGGSEGVYELYFDIHVTEIEESTI